MKLRSKLPSEKIVNRERASAQRSAMAAAKRAARGASEPAKAQPKGEPWPSPPYACPRLFHYWNEIHFDARNLLRLLSKHREKLPEPIQDWLRGYEVNVMPVM